MDSVCSPGAQPGCPPAAPLTLLATAQPTGYRRDAPQGRRAAGPQGRTVNSSLLLLSLPSSTTSWRFLELLQLYLFHSEWSPQMSPSQKKKKKHTMKHCCLRQSVTAALHKLHSALICICRLFHDENKCFGINRTRTFFVRN